MTAKTTNPKQAIKEQERRFREETQHLRKEPAAGSEGYTNVYLEDEPELREQEQLEGNQEQEQREDNQESEQSAAPQPRARQRQSKRPAEVEDVGPSQEAGDQPAPPESAPPSPGAGQPASTVPSQQQSRGAQFAERTKALQQTASAAQTARNVAATIQRAAAVGRVIAFLFSPAMWPVWIGLAIAAGIFLVVLLVMIVACAVTPDWVPPYGMTATLFEAIKSLVNALAGIKCT